MLLDVSALQDSIPAYVELIAQQHPELEDGHELRLIAEIITQGDHETMASRVQDANTPLSRLEAKQKLTELRQLRASGQLTDVEYRAKKFMLQQQMNTGADRSCDQEALSSESTERNLKSAAALSNVASAVQTVQLNDQVLENLGIDEPEIEFDMEEGGESATDEALGQIKLLVSHLQIFGGFTGAISLSWPSIMYDAKSLASSIDFDFNSLLAIPCHVSSVTFYKEMATAAALPVVVVTTMICVHQLALKCGKDLTQTLWSLGIVFVFLVYPGTTQKMLRIFKCKQILGNWYLESDYRHQCYDGEWFSYAMIAIAGIVVITLGVPAFTYVLLTRNRHKLFAQAKFAGRFGFLYAKYEPQYYWFEILEMFRKVSLLGVSLFIAPGTMKQILFCLVLAIMFMVIHIKLQVRKSLTCFMCPLKLGHSHFKLFH